MADDDKTLGTLDDPARARDPAVPTPADPNLGRRVGPYRVERLIAHGGMGAVYLATRQDDFEKRVALKLVHPELRTTEVVRRFAAERQILARLEHPSIARILDGGTTDDALPYFVMEYVEGVPVDRYCDDRGLSLRQRLELFMQICAAIHFAHQNLVVHRDLKPSNILITAEGVPKLLDFGIAKILDAGPGRVETEDGEGPMTPDYASPEQILGEAITTASDVYSLGVLLYRLVSGQRPYRLEGAGPVRRVEMVCRQEPTRPSSAARRAGAGRRQRLRLEGDVDAIILKAMRKKPRERYASALQLAEDLRRHLSDLPVQAHDAGWLYRARKLARRHKAVLAVALLVVSLAVTSTVLWRRSVHQQAETERALQRAQSVSDFLEELFESADPDVAHGKALTVRQALDQGRSKLATELAGEPEIRADLLATLGTVYHNLGHADEARELKEEALRTRRAADPGDRHALAVDLNNLGRSLYDLGDFATAESHYRQALGMWERLGDAAHTALALRNLAALRTQQGAADEALELYRRALRIDRELYGDDDPRVAASLYGLGARYRLAGDPQRAEPLLRQALAIYARSSDAQPTKVASAESSLALVLHAQGRLQEARELLEHVLATRRRLLGDDHVQVATTEKNLAALLLDLDETAAAGDLLERALQTLRRAHPAGHWMIADAESIWGSYLVALGRYETAEPVLLASLRTLAEVKGERHLHTRAARQRLVAFYEARGDEKKAAELGSAAWPSDR